ncbi:hypothetical protein A6E12_09320 [Aliivibrio fischeri]|uniref:lipopolysaccharide biosynthesis protein n=1 Tax=Aliivibrio fischeri TaxID=668 RepID=UPI00080EBD11|nr:hypothetical protein [Aliivibrio fischeri]OCH28870.1 hypothetical protein A6E12_09320 [Aliivibrio fischeri]
MSLLKSNQLALISLFSSSFKVLVGPITLLILAKYLSSEELGFYYTFFSLVAMKQLLEAGMSNVLKQYYAHQVDNVDDIKAKKKISSYFIFSMKWYLMIAFFFSIVSLVVGYLYFYDYKGSIEWENSWYLLIFATFLSLLTMPYQSFLDGNQLQKELQTYNLFSQVVGTIILWYSLYLNFNLISIGLSIIATSISFIFCIFINRFNIFKFSILYKNSDFKSVFFELWPLLKKTGLVWFLGYFYWNGFNVISFKYLGPISAGIIGLSLSLGRAGLNIAISIVISHMTIYAKDIARKKYNTAYKNFIKNAISGMILLLLGYLIFLICQLVFDDFYFFDKVLNIYQLLWMFIFFIISYITSVMDNYTRCYKVEKFVLIQFINSVLTPLSFFISILNGWPYFFGPTISLIVIMIMTFWVFKKVVK